jgi:hypothetical protein
MQTFTVLWCELEAAKRQLKDTYVEAQEAGRANLPGKAEPPSRGIGNVAQGEINLTRKLPGWGDYTKRKFKHG